MHAYLPHLLADITAAHRKVEPNEDVPLTTDALFEDVERYVRGGLPQHTLGYYCGLAPEDFPPAAQFSDAEIIEVCAAFEKLLHTWNAAIHLPEKLPLPLQYQFMVKTLSNEFTLMNHGCINFDFCTGDAAGCEFKEYCPCRKS